MTCYILFEKDNIKKIMAWKAISEARGVDANHLLITDITQINAYTV